jgi:hypothetical protein
VLGSLARYLSTQAKSRFNRFITIGMLPYLNINRSVCSFSSQYLSEHLILFKLCLSVNRGMLLNFAISKSLVTNGQSILFLAVTKSLNPKSYTSGIDFFGM